MPKRDADKADGRALRLSAFLLSDYTIALRFPGKSGVWQFDEIKTSARRKKNFRQRGYI